MNRAPIVIKFIYKNEAPLFRASTDACSAIYFKSALSRASSSYSSSSASTTNKGGRGGGEGREGEAAFEFALTTVFCVLSTCLCGARGAAVFGALIFLPMVGELTDLETAVRVILFKRPGETGAAGAGAAAPEEGEEEEEEGGGVCGVAAAAVAVVCGAAAAGEAGDAGRALVLGEG